MSREGGRRNHSDINRTVDKISLLPTYVKNQCQRLSRLCMTITNASYFPLSLPAGPPQTNVETLRSLAFIEKAAKPLALALCEALNVAALASLRSGKPNPSRQGDVGTLLCKSSLWAPRANAMRQKTTTGSTRKSVPKKGQEDGQGPVTCPPIKGIHPSRPSRWNTVVLTFFLFHS